VSPPFNEFAHRCVDEVSDWAVAFLGDRYDRFGDVLLQ
jgi:hypothetical protein